MIKMKNILLVVIVLALLSIAIFLFLHYRDSILNMSTKTPKTIQINQVQAITVKDESIKDSTKPFSIDITYPSIASFDGFNQKIQTIISKELNDFKTNSLANDTAVKETDPASYAKYPREYDLKIAYTKGEIDQNVMSVIFDVYNFEGGAHGANYFVPLNYDVKNNKEIALADVFSGQTNYLQKISDYCIKDLIKQITAQLGNTNGTWIAQGAGPQAENFSMFLVNKDNIVFYFPQYQIAPYVNGSFQVTMPR